MSKIITSVLALACSATISTEAFASCTIYQHRDYGGSSWTLGDYERMNMIDGESFGCTTNGHGGGCESVTYDSSWNDQVSSFRVSGGCTLTLWQHANQGGSTFESTKSYRYVGGRWNDQASDALCSCQ